MKAKDPWYWHCRAQKCIAQSYLTHEKRPEAFVYGVYPTHVARGQGAFLWDHDGRRYVDFLCGLGTNLLGYTNEIVGRGVISALRDGCTHSLATHLEIEAAEKLKQLFPFVDCVKFLKTADEARRAAIKIGRAVTGLEPVILQPVTTEFSPKRVEWLQGFRSECTKSNVLLIFDESETGFRFRKHSVANLTNIVPDLIILGGAMANGLPLAAVGGKYATMNAGEFFGSTFGGETLALAAARETMTALLTKYDVEWLWKQGQAFIDEFNDLGGGVTIEGYGTRGVLRGTPLARALFMQEACRAGLLFGQTFYFNFPLAGDWRDAMVAIKGIKTRMATGSVRLEGEIPKESAWPSN